MQDKYFLCPGCMQIALEIDRNKDAAIFHKYYTGKVSNCDRCGDFAFYKVSDADIDNYLKGEK